ncbi:helix-turn-helix domain-containing protein [Flavihumibacter sp. UBA7668]|uniref:helix-turn-helix domain-containing protein n=1 Tax=Flavihumibacter sp. UBA7668 TaxID=1946542 RepID=UPI0025C0BD8A|nr:helix-turn-helix transcriptional regulator [Flavihumibacter sp. UBA7668]
MSTTTLKILRDLHGYKQEELAEVLNISQNSYSRLERSPKSLTAEQAQKLAEFYNVGISDILSETMPVLIFKDNKIENSNNGYVGHVENDNRSTANDAIVNALKSELDFLRKQNLELIKALGDRK